MVRKALILVVDDEPPVACLMRATLQAGSYAVDIASGGAEALRLLEHERPNLILLDVIMPGMDGRETLRRIRTSSQLSIILLTARAGDADKQRGLRGAARCSSGRGWPADCLANGASARSRKSSMG